MKGCIYGNDMFKLLHKNPDFQINRVLDFKHLGFKLEPLA